MTTKPRVRVPALSMPTGKAFMTGDSFQNFLTHMGRGTGNVSDGATYGFNPIGRRHTTLEWMYRGSWLVRKIVDSPANDMTRAGLDIEGDLKPDQIEKLKALWSKLAMWQRIRQGLKWGRLYGGAIGVILVDGQKPETPLREETVGKGAFRGLLILDRWMIQPSISDFITELGPDLGLPLHYDTVAGNGIPVMRIHHSRVIRFEGDDLPYWQRITENGWSASVVEQFYERMLAYDSASEGAAQLVYRAHLRTYSVEGLRDLIAAGGPMYQAFLENMAVIRQMQTTQGMTVIDSADKLEYHSPGAFSGLSDVLTQFGQQLSGASGIPLVILFGQSPSGFSTGETDVRNYYDRIKADQEAMLEQPVGKLLRVSLRSMTGQAPPADFVHNFKSLWQMSEKERAELASNITTAVTQAHGEGIIDTPTAMLELRQSADITGVFSNIADEDIAAAKMAPPPIPGMDDGMGAPPGEPGQPALPGAPGSPAISPASPPPPPAPGKPPAPARRPLTAPPSAPPGMAPVDGTPPGIKVNLAAGLDVKVNRHE